MSQTNTDPRIASTLAGDRTWSIIAVLALWALYAFVFVAVMPLVGGSDVVWALAIAGGLVLLFNTAAIVAMIINLSRDRDDIYGLDLHYRDAARLANKE